MIFAFRESCGVTIYQIKEDISKCIYQQTEVTQTYQNIVSQVDDWIDTGLVVKTNSVLKDLEFIPTNHAEMYIYSLINYL